MSYFSIFTNQFVTTKESGNPRGDWDPRDQPTPANEHELYMIRVLLPFMGDGTQLMVDEKSAFKLDINPGRWAVYTFVIQLF